MNNVPHYTPTYDDPDKYWVSSDIFVAATLIALQYKLVSIQWQDSRKAVFVFNRSNELLKTVEQYFEGQLAIDPRLLFDSQRLLKSRLYMPNC